MVYAVRLLVIAAEDLGDRETASVCRQIPREEESMAHFFSQDLPTVVREALHEPAWALIPLGLVRPLKHDIS